MNPLASKVNWMYQKNKHFVDSLILRRAPAFVYSRNPVPHKNEIIVFTFHIALPDWFEEQCRHLAENGYKTLSSQEVLLMLKGELSIPPKAVMITFDDGLKHVWSVAFPILKKYGLCATCFLIPGCIPDSDTLIRPTLEDVWANRAEESEVIAFRRDEPALATWPEINAMQSTGVLDFQSHTMHHSLVFTSREIVTFLDPGYNTHFYGNVFVPLYRQNGSDVYERTPLLGMPIYRGAPRMQAKSRYFDDESLRMACVEKVNNEGGKEFFKRKDWKSTLSSIVKDYRRRGKELSRYETEDERNRAVVEELLQSRETMEDRLGIPRIDHLCFPWYEAESFAVEAARDAGFNAAYFGLDARRKANAANQDPMHIVRVEDVFLQRLPGSNRQTLRQAFGKLVDLKHLTPMIFP
jgi:hypothetical protein